MGSFMLLPSRGGSFICEHLARVIADNERWDECAWVRDPPEEVVAAKQTIIDALALRFATGRSRSANESVGWALAGSGVGLVLVVEVIGRCTSGLWEVLREAVQYAELNDGTVILAANTPFPKTLRRRAPQGTGGLDARAFALAEAAEAGLADEATSRLSRQPALLHDLSVASRRWSADVVNAAISRAKIGRILHRITGALLHETTGDEREALSIASRTGYWHPQFSAGAVESASLRPWVVPLEHGWGWVRPIWRRSLSDEVDRPRRHRSPVRKVPYDTGPDVHEHWQPVLEARLLGGFELRIDGMLVGGMTGDLGSSVVRYLLMRPGLSCPRDELLASFWPEAEPARARNRLQAAVSSVRRRVRQATRVTVIEFSDGRYRINPDLQAIIDASHFERLARLAGEADRTGDRIAALHMDREAVQLYRGDLCSDLPYEEWTIYPRERLRMVYDDVLDRLSRNQWAAGDLEGCIATGNRMLDQDPCREDAHRLMMRAYAALGRSNRAVRQFETCRRVLKATMGIAPSPSTVTTYTEVRDGLHAHQ